jgi:hypothetical protein
MSKKTPPGNATPLKIVDIQICGPTPASQAAGGMREWLHLSVEMENPNGAPLYVWSSDRGYAYDASTHVLSVHLAEVPLNLPPGVTLLSDHHGPPAQMVIAPKSRAKVMVQVPASIRRVVSGKEFGGGWREDAIGEIGQVDIDMQYGTVPVQPIDAQESSSEFRRRLLAYGTVVRAKITPTRVTIASNEKEQ